jgi:hypothetical protein
MRAVTDFACWGDLPRDAAGTPRTPKVQRPPFSLTDAKLMQSRFIPGVDLSGIDFVQLAASFGCKGKRVEKHEDLAVALAESVSGDEP